MVISVVLMTVDHRFHHLDNIRATLSVLVYPVQYLVNLPVAGADWASEAFASRTRLEEQNRKLRTHNLLLQVQAQKISALEAENIRLRELLQSSRKVGERVLIAELLAVDVDPYTRRIVINKGSRDNIYPGQPILDAEGVMGQVIHVGPFSSIAMLITDPSHELPVQVNRNGLRTIAVGTGAAGRLELHHLPNNADITEGDLLVSSGLGGVFPPDYPVATVVAVHTDPHQPFATVEAEPLARLELSREVLLVWREGNNQATAGPTPAPLEATP